MTATGDYPDLVISRNGAVDREVYGVDQKILMPLDDLIDEHLTNYTDRIQECIEKEGYDPTVSLKSSDGKTYSIGYMSAENISTWTQYYINQKWLDTLKLKTPTDVAGLTEVFRAFKTQDPNGNGEADEIPLTFVMDSTGTNNYSIGFMLPLFGIPFGGSERWLYIDDDAKLQFIPTTDEFRQCMEWLHTLYVEELLDIEVLSQDNAALTRKLEDNIVGFVSDWRFFNGTTYAETAGKDFALYVPGSDAKIYHYMELASPRVYLTSTNEHPEKTMQWLNAYLETENMFDLMNGHHNQDKDPSYGGWYYDENGLINTLAKPKDLKLQDYLAGNGLFFAPGPYKNATAAWNANGLEKVEANDVYEENVAYQKYSNDYLKQIALSPDDISVKTLMSADLNTAINEYMARFIMDGVEDSVWYEFLGIMDDIGYHDYVQMHQTALDKLQLK